MIAIVVLPGVAWISQVIGSSLRRSRLARHGRDSRAMSTVLSEALNGKRIIKAYGLEQHASDRAHAQIERRLRFLLKLVRTRAAAVPSSDLFGGLVIGATIGYAGYQAIHGEIGINRFASFLTALLLALQPVRNLTQLWAQASSGVSAADRVFAVIDTKPQHRRQSWCEEQRLLIAPAPLGGAVRFTRCRVRLSQCR